MLASSTRLARAIGPRLEVGFVSGRGTVSNGGGATTVTIGAAGEIELRLNLGAVSLMGGLEAGSLLRGIALHADERDVLHVAGPFVGTALGVML